MSLWTRVCVLLVAVSVSACDLGGSEREAAPRRTPLSSPTGENSHVIGLVGTMSGPDAWRGEDALEGADLAVGLLNAGVPDQAPHYELITLDDGGRPEEATELVAQVAGLDQAVGVIYAGPPEGLPAAEGALADAEIPALLAYGDLYASRDLSPHVFQIPASYLWEARRSVAYFLRDRGYEKLGILAEDSRAGRTAIRATREGIRLYGGRGPSIATYSPKPEDLRSQLAHLQTRRVEAIVFHGDPAAFRLLLAELEESGASYRMTDAARIASLDKRTKRRVRRKKIDRPWRPQVAGLDLAFATVERRPPPGTLVAETYGRGVHYLPVPSLESFRRSFVDWWDAEPAGWEQRAYTGVRAIGWAVDEAPPGEDLAETLEGLRGRRFGGLDVTLGPDDHTLASVTTVGLWVVPRAGVTVRGREDLPPGLPWVPLSRGFSTDGETTDVLPQDWDDLFRNAPPPGGPAPKVTSLRYGVRTKKRDPVH